jgi:hypothetical protein
LDTVFILFWDGGAGLSDSKLQEYQGDSSVGNAQLWITFGTAGAIGIAGGLGVAKVLGADLTAIGTGAGAEETARETLEDLAEDMGPAKAPPNPHGKKGGPEHQEKVKEIERAIKERGLVAEREHPVETPGGEKKKRFVDVVGKDPATKDVREMHQVGRQTKGGRPVAREARALDDIQEATGQRPEFHPYNKTEN